MSAYQLSLASLLAGPPEISAPSPLPPLTLQETRMPWLERWLSSTVKIEITGFPSPTPSADGDTGRGGVRPRGPVREVHTAARCPFQEGDGAGSWGEGCSAPRWFGVVGEGMGGRVCTFFHGEIGAGSSVGVWAFPSCPGTEMRG